MPISEGKSVDKIKECELLHRMPIDRWLINKSLLILTLFPSVQSKKQLSA